MSACSCKNKAALLSRIGMVATEADAPNVDYKLIGKVEKLEKQRNDLSKAIEKEMTSYGTSQTLTLDAIEAARIKMAKLTTTEAKYTAQDEVLADSVKDQKHAMGNVLTAKQAQLARVKADTAAIKEKFDDLDAAMKRCGCR